jgi:hypothetical protein
MAYGNNRAGAQPRAHFRQAGGSIIKFRHPFLIGQVDTTGNIDEIDVSACLKLEGTFFNAQQAQDSAKQVVLIDGSVVTITNKLLNGRLSMPVIKTSGLVGDGDFIAALQLIRATGDSVGGLLIKTDFINGKAITRVYYGVTVQSCPDDISMGNDVPEYPVVLLYAGWIEAVSATTAENMKKIWAVGNAKGLAGYFSPYETQKSSTGSNPIDTQNSGIPNPTLADQLTDNFDTFDSDNEKKALNNDWKSGSTPVVSGATTIEPTSASSEGD